MAEQGLFGLVLPLTCLVIGDAVLGADLRAGTFAFTWLSPVRFPTIVMGRWLGGWLVALVTLVPALVLATVVAGVPEGAGPMAIAAAAGSAAYIGLFVMLGAMARRSAVWALAVVFLGERLLGGVLSGIAQISPMWEAQQVYAGLADTRRLAPAARAARPTAGRRWSAWRPSWWSRLACSPPGASAASSRPAATSSRPRYASGSDVRTSWSSASAAVKASSRRPRRSTRPCARSR